MRKATEVYRLYYEHKMGVRAIARSLKISHSTVSEYLSLFSESGKTYPLSDPEDMNAVLSLRTARHSEQSKVRHEPDFIRIFEELKKKGVTLLLLWQEYREEHQGSGYGYSRFCDLYKGWHKKLFPSMRQQYKAGEKMFVDYAGPTLSYYDAATQKVRI